MSPAKLHDHERPRRSSDQINGPRPSPLKLDKDSHAIHKKPSSSSSAFAQQRQRTVPVIIYTHSPKIIHTQARDFMALVQNLTGLSPRNSDHHDHAPPPSQPPPQQGGGGGGEGGVGSVISPVMKPPADPNFLADIPLFTPSSTDHFFCSPRAMYRSFSKTSANGSGNCNNPISPSVLEFFKGLPEY